MKHYRSKLDYCLDGNEHQIPILFSDPAWNHRAYILNYRSAQWLRDEPFNEDRYIDCEALVDIHKGEDAYIFCPGPSMGMIDLSLFSDKLTIAVNSAMFALESRYWVASEGAYILWLEPDMCRNRCFLTTARAALLLRRRGLGNLFSKIFILRWMEAMITPPNTLAVSTTDALVTAWEMGCPRAYLVGCDLSRPEGVPYLKGVPYTRRGAKLSFDGQIKALSQFELPDFEIVNVSPYSKDKLKKFEYMSIENLEKTLKEEEKK